MGIAANGAWARQIERVSKVFHGGASLQVCCMLQCSARLLVWCCACVCGACWQWSSTMIYVSNGSLIIQSMAEWPSYFNLPLTRDYYIIALPLSYELMLV